MSLTIKIILMASALVPLWCGAADALGVVTIVDGDGVLIRKTQKIQLKAGTRLFAQDLLQTDAKGTLVRVELNKGGVFDFGPGSLGIVRPGLTSGSGQAASLYFVKGWLKVSAAPGVGSASSAVLSEQLEVPQVPGSAVLSSQAGTFQVFAENAALSVSERRLGKSGAPTAVPAGAYFAGVQGEKALISPRVPGSFIQSVPKGFQESIPSLKATFMARPEPIAKSLGELSYADAEPWLAAEPMVRGLLLALWKNQLPSDLRQGLSDHIGSHPEWRSTLFPEKDIPRKPPVPGLANK